MTFTAEETKKLSLAIGYRLGYISDEEIVAAVRPEFLEAITILHTTTSKENADRCVRDHVSVETVSKAVSLYEDWINTLAKVKEVV